MSLSLADRQAILALLHQEVVPALGCTEPIAVALTAARAAEALGRKPERLDVAVSANLLKNGMGVMVPGTGEMGLAIAAAAGALGGKSALGLECLASLDPAQAEAARAMVTADAVELHLPDNDLLLYCLVTAHADGHSAAAELRDSHDNITRVWQDGALVEDHMPAEANEAAPADWPLTLARVYEFATTAPLEEISFILEAARMNRQVAEEGLSSQYGLGVGKSMDARVRKHILSDDLPTFAIRLTAAAADARMAGVMMPVMSNSGSGNQGITCTMPVVACAIRQESSNEDLARALMMSHLTSIHIKHHLGRLSAHCGAMVAATAAGCGIALLLDGDLNLLKGAILTADAVNAVSPTYAQELKNPYFAHRMEGILTQCGYKLSGVLNGIDMKLYDPAADGRITANYTAEDLSGKAADKTALQNLMGLNEEPNTPIIAMVSRLVSHKGLDLLREVMGDIMELPAQFVVLGSGDAGYEEFFRRTAERYPGRMAVRLGYNEALSMAIYAGADLFLMPSRSEPCGLSQMISMRYGTVPIVRETGGLKDTVQPYEAWRDAGTGFTFANYSSADMLHVIREAVYLYKDYPDAFARLRDRAMAQDFSWNRSAGDYLRIYGAVTGLSWEKSAPEAPAAEAAAPAEEPVIEVPAEEAAVSAAEPVSETAAKPAAKKAARKTAVKKPAAKKTTTRKTAAKATTKKAAEKAVEKPTEKAAEKPVEEPAEEPVKKTAAKTMAPADTVETTQPVQPKKKGAAKKAAK